MPLASWRRRSTPDHSRLRVPVDISERGTEPVVSSPRQGELWWAEAEDKRRPVLVVTSSEAIPVLAWIIVAP